jgi:hypothetical protein
VSGHLNKEGICVILKEWNWYYTDGKIRDEYPWLQLVQF